MALKTGWLCPLHDWCPLIWPPKNYYFMLWQLFQFEFTCLHLKYCLLCHQCSVKNIIHVLFDLENWLDIVHYMVGVLRFGHQKIIFHIITIVSRLNFLTWMTNIVSCVTNVMYKNYTSTFWHGELTEYCSFQDWGTYILPPKKYCCMSKHLFQVECWYLCAKYYLLWFLIE